MTYYILQDITATKITAIDLLKEVKTYPGPVEACRIGSEENSAFRGQVIFLPWACRAGLFLGADSVWTDASSLQDAVERLNNDSLQV